MIFTFEYNYRLQTLFTLIKAFIEINYPIQNTLMIFQGEDDISDQKQRIYNGLMSDESLIIDDIYTNDIEVKSQVSLGKKRKHSEKYLNKSMDAKKIDIFNGELIIFFVNSRCFFVNLKQLFFKKCFLCF